MRRFMIENGLSLFFGTILILALAGQAGTGLAEFNQQQLSAGLAPVGLGSYLLSSDFAVDVAENWQSEFLQFLLYIYATVWLLQRGSSESKELGRSGRESDQDQLVGAYATDRSPSWAQAGGWRLAIYSRSLALMMGMIFLLSWLAQSIAGRASYNAQQLSEYQDPVSWFGYIGSAEFWNRTVQNWQSEFLAVACMAVFAIYLRQRGSPESKPVGAPHDSTGVEG